MVVSEFGGGALIHPDVNIMFTPTASSAKVGGTTVQRLSHAFTRCLKDTIGQVLEHSLVIGCHEAHVQIIRQDTTRELDNLTINLLVYEHLPELIHGCCHIAGCQINVVVDSSKGGFILAVHFKIA